MFLNVFTFPFTIPPNFVLTEPSFWMRVVFDISLRWWAFNVAANIPINFALEILRMLPSA
jgi:hypothetical protein